MRALGSKQELIASFITRDLDTRRRASITQRWDGTDAAGVRYTGGVFINAVRFLFDIILSCCFINENR